MDDLIQYLPPPDTFWPQNMDVYTNTGSFPPAAGNKRLANISCMIVGTFPEGHRSKVASTDAYTHIIICDTQLDIRDPYSGAGQALGSTPDYISVPAARSSGQNWWKVVYSFITTLPGLGQKRIIMADRWGTPGTWANVP